VKVLNRISLPILTLVTVGAFLGTWYVLAGHLAGWGDEFYHLYAAKGLLLTGKPFQVAFHQCQDVFHEPYSRSQAITQWTAWAFQIFDISLRSARVVPLLFTLATWLLYVVYVNWRGYSNWKQTLVVTILFFGQTMVLEMSLFIRHYAPLLFFLLLSLITIWEASMQWREGKKYWTIPLLLAAVLVFGYTTPWHLIQIPIFALAIFLLWFAIHDKPFESVLRRWWNRIDSLSHSRGISVKVALSIAGLATFVLFPRVLDVFGFEIFGSFRVYLTPWDNVFGLLRFLIVVNVLVLLWWQTGRQQSTHPNFHNWLLSTGIMSGILIAVMMNQHWIFYTRYLYLSAAIATLGASFAIASLPSNKVMVAGLAIFLILNGLISTSTFRFVSSDVKPGIAWLNHNIEEQDFILEYGSRLDFHGGEGLCNQTIPIQNVEVVDVDSVESQSLPLGTISHIRNRGEVINDSKYPFVDGDSLLTILQDNPSSNFYFLYTDTHESRAKLYRWTTGRERNVGNDLYSLLRSESIGEPVVRGQTSGGLRRLDTAKLVIALETRSFP